MVGERERERERACQSQGTVQIQYILSLCAYFILGMRLLMLMLTYLKYTYFCMYITISVPCLLKRNSEGCSACKAASVIASRTAKECSFKMLQNGEK